MSDNFSISLEPDDSQISYQMNINNSEFSEFSDAKNNNNYKEILDKVKKKEKSNNLLISNVMTKNLISDALKNKPKKTKLLDVMETEPILSERYSDMDALSN